MTSGRRPEDRIDASHTWVVYDGPPFVDPLEGRSGVLGELCATLTVAQVAELCRWLDWRRRSTRDARASWHYSTRLSLGQRLLAAHGLRPDAWRT